MNKFFSRYATDKESEESGQWIDFGDGIEVQIRRLNSTKSKEVRRRLEKPYSKQFRGQDLPDDIQEKLLNLQMAQAIVVNWKGVPNPENPDDSKPFPCNEENILAVIKKFPDFRDDILTASMERATFQKEALKAAEEN